MQNFTELSGKWSIERFKTVFGNMSNGTIGLATHVVTKLNNENCRKSAKEFLDAHKKFVETMNDEVQWDFHEDDLVTVPVIRSRVIVDERE